MCQTEINFLAQKKLYANCKKFNLYLVKMVVKFRNVQISKILNTITNRILPFKVMYISFRYSYFEKQFHSK